MSINAKEILSNVKKLLFGIEQPVPPAPVEGTEYNCGDGTKCMIDKLEVGGKVVKDGVAVPDGAITLEDATVVTVTGGVITQIEKPTPPAPTPLETPEQMRAALGKLAGEAPADQQAMITVIKALFESVFGWELRRAQEKATVDAAIAAYQQGFAKQETTINTLIEANKELVKLVEFMAENTPIEKPVDTPEKEWDQMSPLEKYRFSKQVFNQD